MQENIARAKTDMEQAKREHGKLCPAPQLFEAQQRAGTTMMDNQLHLAREVLDRVPATWKIKLGPFTFTGHDYQHFTNTLIILMIVYIALSVRGVLPESWLPAMFKKTPTVATQTAQAAEVKP